MKSKLEILAILTILFIQPAVAVSFTSRDLGTNGGISSVAYGINDSGTVVGQYDSGTVVDQIVSSSATSRGFIWSEQNGMSEFTVDAHTTTKLFDINNKGEIIGLFTCSSCWDPFIWSPENGVVALNFGGTVTIPQALNNPGAVTGQTDAWGIDMHGFLWFPYSPDSATNLGTLGGLSTNAFDINDLGEIVGLSTVDTGLYKAFVWKDGVMTNIGPIGTTLSNAVAINNHGDIVGESTTLSGTNATVWMNDTSPRRVIDLGIPGYASAINDHNQVVGATTVGRELRAFYWTEADGIVLLSDVYSTAEAINNKGQIVGRNDNNATIWEISSGAYDFTGFFSPIDNIPMVNSVRAGGAVPVKFSLNGNQGLDIFDTGYPKSSLMTCGSETSEIGANETVNAGQSGLFYNATLDQYEYIWKTEKSWSGKCRQLVLKFNDGITIQRANFQFK